MGKTMNRQNKIKAGFIAILSGILLLMTGYAMAEIQGVTGTAFNLVAKEGYISTGDGDSVYMWGYAHTGPQALHNNGSMQFPGPTLIVEQGDTVTVTLDNALPDPDKNSVSIVFPGQTDVTRTGGTEGLMTSESTGPGDIVTYSFTAGNAGTYVYHSGTQSDLQVEMGLIGTLIVRPATANQAYDDAATTYEHEYLYMVNEADAAIHALVQSGQQHLVDMSKHHPVLWFVNGRNLPDDLFADFAPWLPNQPYGGTIRMHPGDRVLMRFVGGSLDTHPLHLHGNNFEIIARDGRMLESDPGNSGPDLAVSDNTLPVLSMATYDAIFEWTGEKLGFDVYGPVAHDCIDNVDNRTGAGTPDGYDDGLLAMADGLNNDWEYCADHNMAFPVILPELLDMTFGGFYSGSQYLGDEGALPIGEGGLNLNGGFMFPWHSHTEAELVNNDVFPGGMFTILIVEPPAVPIP